MQTNKAPGKGKVRMRIIKHRLPVIRGALTDIINASMTSSEFPQSWREEEGDHEPLSNNRPLSLCTVCKQFAKMFRQIRTSPDVAKWFQGSLSDMTQFVQISIYSTSVASIIC